MKTYSGPDGFRSVQSVRTDSRPPHSVGKEPWPAKQETRGIVICIGLQRGALPVLWHFCRNCKWDYSRKPQTISVGKSAKDLWRAGFTPESSSSLTRYRIRVEH